MNFNFKTVTRLVTTQRATPPWFGGQPTRLATRSFVRARSRGLNLRYPGRKNLLFCTQIIWGARQLCTQTQIWRKDGHPPLILAQDDLSLCTQIVWGAQQACTQTQKSEIEEAKILLSPGHSRFSFVTGSGPESEWKSPALGNVKTRGNALKTRPKHYKTRLIVSKLCIPLAATALSPPPRTERSGSCSHWSSTGRLTTGGASGAPLAAHSPAGGPPA